MSEGLARYLPVEIKRKMASLIKNNQPAMKNIFRDTSALVRYLNPEEFGDYVCLISEISDENMEAAEKLSGCGARLISYFGNYAPMRQTILKIKGASKSHFYGCINALDELPCIITLLKGERSDLNELEKMTHYLEANFGF